MEALSGVGVSVFKIQQAEILATVGADPQNRFVEIEESPFLFDAARFTAYDDQVIFWNRIKYNLGPVDECGLNPMTV